jgi:hypothetical protein
VRQQDRVHIRHPHPHERAEHSGNHTLVLVVQHRFRALGNNRRRQTRHDVGKRGPNEPVPVDVESGEHERKALLVDR